MNVQMYKWRYDQIESDAFEQFIDLSTHEVGKPDCNANSSLYEGDTGQEATVLDRLQNF